MNLKYLFRPITIANMELKNRIVMPCINHSYSPDGMVNERLIAYYATRARGGVGMITVGGCAVHELGRSFQVICIYDDKFNQGLERLTEAVHANGAKIVAQLYHAGGYAKSKEIGGEPIAPSAVKSKYTRETPRAMSKQDILAVQEYFVQAAKRAKLVGFDGVELIGSAGYLIAEFLSPYTNVRTDEYGGSFDNRCRFVIELIGKIKAAVGKEYPVLIRISGHDFIAMGNTNEQAVQVAQQLEAAGVDAINVTGGWHESKIPQTTGELPTAGFGYLAANIKKAVGVPVIASNRINDPVQAEKMIAMGLTDLVNMGRPLLADPELPNKAKRGELEVIRRCIACGQGCFDRRFSGRDVQCMINYRAGREYQLSELRADKVKKILVIGGGVAGMEFAINAAARGHEVSIWEQTDKLGGQLHCAAKPIGKQEFKYLISYQVHMLEKLGVQIILNKTADINNVKEFAADAVIVATGSKPILPDFAQVDTDKVVLASDVLLGNVIAGQCVVVVGGGAVGCETAIALADEGTLSAEQVKFLLLHQAESEANIRQMLITSCRDVTIIEMGMDVGKDIGISTRWVAKKHLTQLGIKSLLETKVLDINKDGVIVQGSDGESWTIPADTVVIAVGSKSEHSLYDALKAECAEVYMLGDVVQAGKMFDGITAAVELGMSI